MSNKKLKKTNAAEQMLVIFVLKNINRLRGINMQN